MALVFSPATRRGIIFLKAFRSGPNISNIWILLATSSMNSVCSPSSRRVKFNVKVWLVSISVGHCFVHLIKE